MQPQAWQPFMIAHDPKFGTMHYFNHRAAAVNFANRTGGRMLQTSPGGGRSPGIWRVDVQPQTENA